MLRTLMGVMAVLAVAAVCLIGPGAAFACSGTSAVCVYTPGSVNAGGGGAVAPGQKPRTISKQVAKNLARAGKDKTGLQYLVQQPGLGTTRDRSLATFNPNSVSPPSAFSAIFDLGTGALTLIAALVGSALLLLLGTGWRGWRRWRGTRLAA